jgi:FolB domain-containing protein
MVWVRDVAFYSLCEHHLLPFFGHCTVAYLPKGKVLGLSKIHDVVKMYARRLQLQERLTEQIAQTIYALCPSEGVGVFMRAKHLCIAMRGVQQETSETETYRLLGRFEEDESTRREFLTGLQRNKTNMLPSLLEVRTLPISVSLGCDAEEKRTKTTVHLDLSLKFPSPPPACSTDRLEDTLCYDRLSKSVARFCGRKHFNLIEHLAYDLYRHLKEKWIPSLYSSSPALRVCLIKDLSSSHQSRFTVGDF